MGSILDFIKKLVNWVGDLIHSVVQWFESHVREVVLNKTEDFLNEVVKPALAPYESMATETAEINV